MHPESTAPAEIPSINPAEVLSDGPAGTAYKPVASQAAVWRELGRDAGVGNGPPAVFGASLRAALQLLPDVTSGAIYVYLSERLTRPASQWSPGGRDGATEAAAAGGPAGDALAAAVARSGKPEFVPDLSSHPKFTANGQTGPAGRLVALPLRSGGRLVGVINLAFAPGRAFSPDDHALLERLNEQAAVAIDSTWLFEITRRQVRELTALHLVSIAAAEATGEDELIGRATQIIGGELFPDKFGILLLDPTVGGLRLQPSYQGVADRSLAVVIPLSAGISGAVASTGRPARVADMRAEPSFFDWRPMTLSELCVPLKIGERVIGVVNAESA